MAYVRIHEKPKTIPQIWDPLNGVKVGEGGAMLDVSELPTDRNYGALLKGCPIYVDTNAVAHVVKSALVISGGTTSAPRVDKDHMFMAADSVFVSGAAVTITSIDESNSEYDVLNLSAPCGNAVAGQIIEQAEAAGDSPVKKYSPNTLLGDDANMVDGETVNLVFRINEWVKKEKFAYPMSDTTIASLAPNIIIK